MTSGATLARRGKEGSRWLLRLARAVARAPLLRAKAHGMGRDDRGRTSAVINGRRAKS